MWARERRVWASGGQAPASPGLAHTLHRTALGAQDASPSSPLGVTRAAVVVSTPRGTTEELARAGGRTPPGHGRCSFGMRRGLPASNTFRPGRGVMQDSIAVRITPTGDAHSHATVPVRARARAGHASLAGTALRATPPSAGCRTVWPHGFLASWTRSKRWWPTPSRPRAWPPRPMGCAATRSSSRGRCAGSSLGSVLSITS